MSELKISYPKLHSYKLNGAENVERIPVCHKTEDDNPYIVLAEVIKIPNIKNVSIAYFVGDDQFSYRTNRPKVSGAIFDFQAGILKAMDVLK